MTEKTCGNCDLFNPETNVCRKPTNCGRIIQTLATFPGCAYHTPKQSGEANGVEYKVTLHISEQEKTELDERIKADGCSPEIWFKKSICSFTQGMMFNGDDVWFISSNKPEEKKDDA